MTDADVLNLIKEKGQWQFGMANFLSGEPETVKTAIELIDLTPGEYLELDQWWQQWTR
jgi:hypothetical protein